ncbi:CDP-glucose 4,6-dehydratase [Paenibacillus sp. P25]|nr:CDP-glucose 4,6-dehydratase [Paenibacillus sp. P25]
MEAEASFWNRRKVFVTGHTGFKGAWLTLWSLALGAEVHGYALEPPEDEPNLFRLAGLEARMTSTYGDIRDERKLACALAEASPEIVFHLCAQPLVQESYSDPVETFSVNVMGTVHLLEAVRTAKRDKSPVRCVINVTTDKCYDNREWVWGYRENDPLGGHDPYSSSKACSELVTSSYRKSFFPPEQYTVHGVALATARAGNVIGGGDWAKNRLIPDCVRALLAGGVIELRNPDAVRPWQHVLDPLYGYLLLAQQLYLSGPSVGEAWNFGPRDEDARTVEWMTSRFCEAWGEGASYRIAPPDFRWHEHRLLKLDCSKAHNRLGWRPRWNAEQAIARVVEWTKRYLHHEDPYEICLSQIRAFTLTRTGVNITCKT